MVRLLKWLVMGRFASQKVQSTGNFDVEKHQNVMPMRMRETMSFQRKAIEISIEGER